MIEMVESMESCYWIKIEKLEKKRDTSKIPPKIKNWLD